MIKVSAVLCSLINPLSCHEETVTDSNFSDVTMQSCMMGMPQLAKWMEDKPMYRLASWKCQLGDRGHST